MLDEFRQEADEPSYEEDTFSYEEIRPRTSLGNFLGMTPAQRFVLAMMLLVTTCLLGTFLLLVTERIVPPF